MQVSEPASGSAGGYGEILATPSFAGLPVGLALMIVQYFRYCSATSLFFTRWPTLDWPRKPDGVMLVEPVHTCCGGSPSSLMMNLLCGIGGRVRAITTGSSAPS